MPKNIFSFFSKQRLSAAVLKNLTAELLTFLEQFPSAVLLVDQQGKVGLVNPAAVSLLGREATDLVGLDVKEVLGVSVDELAQWQSDTQKHLLPHLKKENAPLQAGVKQLGETEFWQITLDEVPQFHALQQEKDFFEGLLNQYPVAVTVQDATGKCLFANKMLGTLFDLTKAEVEGKVVYKFLPKQLAALLYNVDEDLKAGKLPTESIRWTDEQGRVISVHKRWLGPKGEDASVILTFYEDVTVGVANEQKLERDQKLLHAILENIPLGLYTRDCDEKMTFFNKQSMQILNETSAYRTDHPNEYQEDAHIQEYREREQQILRDGKTYEYPEEVYTDSSGKKKIIHMIKVPLLDAGPKPMVLTIVEDITKRREQEKEIQRVNSFFSALVENAPIALYARAEDGHLLLRNKQCTNLFGPAKDGEFDERGGLIHESNEQVTNYMNRERDILLSGKTVDIPEEEYINSNGERKLLHLIKTPLEQARGVLTLAEDITFKKEQERALVDYKNFLQAIINQLPVSLSVKNYEGQYILWNKKSEELFGVAAKDVMGKSAYRADLNKEQMEFVRETDLRVFESKKEQNIPQELISSPTEGIKIMHTVKTPVFNEDGTPNCLLIVSEDITAKTKMEKQIREANDKSTLLVDNAREGVVMVEDEKIIYANQAFCNMLGAGNLNEIKNKSLLDFSTENHRVFLKEKYEAVRSGADEKDTPIEAHFLRKDGSKIETKFSVVLAKYLGRRVVLGFARDVTADNRALREIKKERDHFRQAFEKSALPAFVLSSRGYISMMNAAGRELLGFTSEDKKFYCNVYIRPGLPLAVRKAIKAGEPARLDYTLDFDKLAEKFPGRIHKDGQIPLTVQFEPFSKRDTRVGVEADYLVSLRTPTHGEKDSAHVPPAAAIPAPVVPAAAPLSGGTQAVKWALPTSEPYALCNSEFHIVDCNELLCSLCQLQPDELKGQDIRRLFHNDEKPLIEQDFALLAQDGKLANREYTLCLASGLETCKVRLSALKQEDGTYLFMLRNLTFHAQVMKILEERSAQLGALRASLDGALLRVGFEEHRFGPVEQLNDWLSCKTNFLPEELNQYTFEKLFATHASDGQTAEAVLAEAAAQVAKKGKSTFVLPLLCKNGATFQAQVTLVSLENPASNEVLAIVTDWSSQQGRAGVDSVQAQELASLRKTLPGLYLRVDEAGKVLEVSSNLPGLDEAQARETFLGKTMTDFWPPETAEQLLFSLKEALAVRVTSHVEFEWPRPGQGQFYEAEISPLNKNNEAVVWVKDISEKRIYDRRLHELYQLVQESSASLSEQVDKALSLGKDIFQAQVGFLVTFERKAGGLQSCVLYASANPLHIQKGERFAVEECLRDVADGAALLQPNLEGLSCQACIHRAKKLGMLLATPLRIGGKVAGALCFASTESRKHIIPGAEELLGLMARLIGLRIELKQAGAKKA